MPQQKRPAQGPKRRPAPAAKVSNMQRRRAVSPKQSRRVQALFTLLFCIAVFILVCAGCFLLVKTDGTAADSSPAQNQPESSAAEQNPDAGDGTADGGEEQPAMTEEEQRIADATATAAANCTKDAPQITDPAQWDERGKALMEQLAADSFFQSEGFKYDAKSDCPYMIAVNRAASTVTVLALDDEGNYTRPYMAMVCSGGEDTPLGFFATPANYDWRTLAGPSYGQYATRIWDAYLFHTVPYYSQHKDDIEYDQFNQLGTQASLGCIRLLVCDVKWIYDNCPIGTRVVIYDNADDPGPMGKPGTIYTDPADESKRGWDPTDPDPENPWDAAFRSGTAIRSEDAWNEWNDAQSDGRWNGSINPTDLQGWSTDSSVEGTRG